MFFLGRPETERKPAVRYKEKAMKLRRLALSTVMLTAAFTVSCGGNPEFTTFTDDDAGFSFEYPADYKPDVLQASTEVARFAMDNQFKLPVLVATVRERREGTEPADSAELFIEALRTGLPGTSGFEIVERNPVVLEDGTDAAFFRIGWKWVDGSTAMETVGVAAFKDGRLIIISGTALVQQGVSEDLAERCLSLKMIQ